MTRGSGRDEGSAVAEFAAVAGLLALLFAAVVQLAVVQHVRATAADCAGEGARFGALRGNSPADGAARTRELLATSLSPAFAREVSAGTTRVAGTPVVEVDVRAPLPVVAFLGPRLLHVQGHALAEPATQP
ncbi:TadE/TadG family type IV pilus assembly protein [Kineococcus rhizosphaerae]|uniref:TadE-like protein n=1 Tax=Kineococcus rhizosphaerae TaxID=559628 RepID=A0A2T0R3X3_9ACTN|nr:TadE/TadG family type IV pilus assembly protein [Kineococcus rhizosphaerae]PRY14744.1 TadE-like protein [Kineococcus rhizosphaerae]